MEEQQGLITVRLSTGTQVVRSRIAWGDIKRLRGMSGRAQEAAAGDLIEGAVVRCVDEHGGLLAFDDLDIAEIVEYSKLVLEGDDPKPSSGGRRR